MYVSPVQPLPESLNVIEHYTVTVNSVHCVLVNRMRNSHVYHYAISFAGINTPQHENELDIWSGVLGPGSMQHTSRSNSGRERSR